MHNLFFLPNTKYILNLSFLNHSAIISCSMEYKLIFKENVLYMICSYFNVYDTIVSKYNIGGLASYLLNRCVQDLLENTNSDYTLICEILI